MSLATTRRRHVGNDSDVERYDTDLWTDEFAFLNQPGQADIQSDLFYDDRKNVDGYPMASLDAVEAAAIRGAWQGLIILWTVSIFPTYVNWHLRTLGRPWGALPGWAMLLEYGSVAIAAAIIALRRIPQSPAPQCSTE